jgi:hypothetical protein
MSLRSILIACACLSLVLPEAVAAQAPPQPTPYRGLFPPSCRNQQIKGGAVGAVAGGVLGALAGGRRNRAAGAILGAGAGAFAGSQIARALTRCDQDLAQQMAVDTARTGEAYTAVAPSNHTVETQLVAPPTRDDAGRACKKVAVGISDSDMSKPVTVCDFGGDDWRVVEDR